MFDVFRAGDAIKLRAHDRGVFDWFDVGDVMTVRLPGQPQRRYLVTARRPIGERAVELSLLVDPEDDEKLYVFGEGDGE